MNQRPRKGVTTYTTRGMKIEVLDRIRAIAAIEETTIEAVVNRALVKGLRELERELGKRRPR